MSTPSHQPPAHRTPEVAQQVLDPFYKGGLCASAVARRRGSAQAVARQREQAGREHGEASPGAVEPASVGTSARQTGAYGNPHLGSPPGHTAEVVGADRRAVLTITLRPLLGGTC